MAVLCLKYIALFVRFYSSFAVPPFSLVLHYGISNNNLLSIKDVAIRLTSG
jgi:hypothetical protein